MITPRFPVSLCFALILVVSAGAGIRPHEALEISIAGVPELDRRDFDRIYPVSARGAINLPLLGEVQAAGLQAMELARRIEGAYRRAEIYRQPTVNVKVISDDRLNAKRLYVGGFVRKSGRVGFVEGMTVWQALQEAGGETPFGSIKRVELFRGGKRILLDLRRDEHKHRPVREGDSISVPQKRPFE